MANTSNGVLHAPPAKAPLQVAGDLLLLLALVLGSLILGMGAVLLSLNPWTLFVLITAAIIGPLLWWRPALAVYLLMGGAVLFETYQLRYPDSLTDRVPFFRSIESLGGPLPLPVSVAELLMVGVLGLVALRRMAQRRSPLTAGPFWWPLGLFLLILLSSAVHGLLTGGSFVVIAWELRGLLYLAFAYLLVVNLVDSPGQVRLLMGIALTGIGLKGLLASWRYVVTLEGDLSRTSVLSTTNSLMSHEESYFFALFLVFIAAAWLLRVRGTQFVIVLVLMPAVVLAFLANERRAGILSLFLGLLVVALLVYVTTRERRKVIALLAIATIVVMPLYVVALGNDEGLIAEPAVAISSTYQPGARDFSSNRYRSLENDNLLFNIMRRPVWGHGFGKAIPLLVPVPDLSDLWTLWAYIPHNTILWVWYRAGFAGFVAFWVVVGRFLLGGIYATKAVDDAYLRTVSTMAVVAVVAWVAFGLLDLGLTEFRSTVVVGMFVGLAAIIPRLHTQQPKDGSTESKAFPRGLSDRTLE